MSNTTESPFSFTTKVKGDLLTVRGDTVDTFASRLIELATHAVAMDAITDLQAMGTMAGAVSNVKDVAPGSSVEAIQTGSAGPREVTDKYGAVFTYGLAEAPALDDGRDGHYIKKVWTDAKGKARKAWVDPVKGPEPAAPAASGKEADIIWI